MPDKKIEKVACYWHISHPVDRDVTMVFKIQHILFTDGTAHSEYGGYGGEWRPFVEMQTLTTHPGVLEVPGREWMLCSGMGFMKFTDWMDAHA